MGPTVDLARPGENRRIAQAGFFIKAGLVKMNGDNADRADPAGAQHPGAGALCGAEPAAGSAAGFERAAAVSDAGGGRAAAGGHGRDGGRTAAAAAI